MLNTHAMARSLTDAEFTPAQADAITDAVRPAAEHGDQVTSDQFKPSPKLRIEMAGQRAELTGDRRTRRAQSASKRLTIQLRRSPRLGAPPSRRTSAAAVQR